MHRAEHRAPVLVGLHVEQRAERDVTSGTGPSTGGIPEVAVAKVELDAAPASAACSRATSSIPSERSTPITRIPSAATGIAIRPVPTPSSTTGPPERRARST